MGFYAPTSRFGSPEDLMYFIDRCHQHQLAGIQDWVPAHFPKDGAGLNFFDGTQLYALLIMNMALNNLQFLTGV